MSYGTNKYSYVALVNAAVVTLTLGRKIFSYDVEIIKNEKVKNLYISMISDLIEFEKTIKKTDPYQIRMYPSNIEAGIQV